MNKIAFKLAKFFDRKDLVLLQSCFLLLMASAILRFTTPGPSVYLKVLIGFMFFMLSSGVIFNFLLKHLKNVFLKQIQLHQLDKIGLTIHFDEAVRSWINHGAFEDLDTPRATLNLLTQFYRMDEARNRKDLFFSLLCREELTEQSRGDLIYKFHDVYLDTTLIKDGDLVNSFTDFLANGKPFIFENPTHSIAKLHCVYPQKVRLMLEEKGLHHKFMYESLGKGYSRYNPPTILAFSSQSFDEYCQTQGVSGTKLRKIISQNMLSSPLKYVHWEFLMWLEFNRVFNFNYDVLCSFFEKKSYNNSNKIYQSAIPDSLSEYQLAVVYLKKRYSDRKILKLLTTVNQFRDFFTHLRLLNSLLSQKIYPSLPKKAKTWTEVAVVISGLELKLNQGNFPLELGKLAKFDGVKLGELNILVPRTNFKLIELAMMIKNCTGEGEYSTQINQKKIHLFFLEQKGVIKYCVETDFDLKITAIKGIMNAPVSKVIEDNIQSFLYQKYLNN